MQNDCENNGGLSPRKLQLSESKRKNCCAVGLIGLYAYTTPMVFNNSTDNIETESQMGAGVFLLSV